MSGLLEFLDGKKFHLVVAVFIFAMAVEGGLGVDIPGFEVPDNWLDYILAAFGLSAGRDALRKVGA